MAFRDWAIEQHAKTNHLYDKDLPYRFHLQMVVNEVYNFRDLVKSKWGVSFEELVLAAWGHDLIEDARVSYNDIMKGTNPRTANIIYAVTNEKGKTRAERANDVYYRGIRNTPGGAFIKFCDRIANVRYGLMMGSDMVDVYRKENEKFVEALYSPELQPMIDTLNKLLG
jgi:(p)ppGpp synthase/HD superfamily hydrolase